MNLSEKQIRDLIVNLSGEKQVGGSFLCKHFNTQSDYLGVTCLSCKKVVAGRGFGGTAEKCMHVYEKTARAFEECTYCGEKRNKY
ncbi:hypothetical protein [Lacihabitans lacunae]|uniref:Uncharacterized protein n=1 Tax=Lacihabitans lacunae TaxID=1028214 RepID=A0ABV7Z4P7_9BACT